MVVSAVEAPGLRLCPRCLTQVHVLLSPLKLDFLLAPHLIEVERVFGAGSVSCHLIRVLFLGSLGLGPLGIEVGADLGEGFLQNPRLLLPRDQCLFPSRELLLSC
jgi:hypothetical protein